MISSTILAAVLLAAPPPVIGDLHDYRNAGASRGSAPESVEHRVLAPTTFSGELPELGPPTLDELRILSVADEGCINAAGVRQAPSGRLDLWTALALLRLERDAGVDAPGLILATWCRESSYGQGDVCTRAGSCDGGLAAGPLQLHGIFVRLCWAGVDRREDILAAAECYMGRVALRAREVERRCGVDWLAAEAAVANWPRYRGRCGAVSEHGLIWKRWRAR